VSASLHPLLCMVDPTSGAVGRCPFVSSSPQARSSARPVLTPRPGEGDFLRRMLLGKRFGPSSDRFPSTGLYRNLPHGTAPCRLAPAQTDFPIMLVMEIVTLLSSIFLFLRVLDGNSNLPRPENAISFAILGTFLRFSCPIPTSSAWVKHHGV